MKNLVTFCFALGLCLLSRISLDAQCNLQIQVDVIVNTHQICQGTGSICALVTQGVGPYTFKWSNGYTSVSSAESCAQNLVPDIYEVTVYDMSQPGWEATFAGVLPAPTEKDCPDREKGEQTKRERKV